jgi:hypothetical protein
MQRWSRRSSAGRQPTLRPCGRRASFAIAPLVAALVLLAIPALAAAVPLQYPNGWDIGMSGLRQMPFSLDTRALCKGPAGSVYEVALSHTTEYYAGITRFRVSDGAELKSWTYPATPGPGVIPYAAASDAAGNLFVAVETQTGKRNWVVLKYSRAGKQLWKRSYDSGQGQDTPYGMAVDHHGNVIVAGTSEMTGGYDGAVVKWSASGRRLWKRTIGSTGLDLIGTVAVDAGNNVYVAGDIAGGGGAAVLRSYTPGGRERWRASVKNLVGTPTFRCLVVKGASVYAAGQSTSIPSDSSFLAMKYTTSGKRAWSAPKTLSYANGAWASGLAVDRAGAPVVVGVAYGIGASGQNLGAVWKLTAKGAPAWHEEFSNDLWPHDGEFGAVGVDSKNRIYAAGGQWVTAGTGNLLMVRYSPGGTEQAMWRSDGQQSGCCAFSDVLVLSDTQVVAAGKVAGNGQNAAVYRAKTTTP